MMSLEIKIDINLFLSIICAELIELYKKYNISGIHHFEIPSTSWNALFKLIFFLET